MSMFPFECLVVASRDADIDAVAAQLLEDAGHAVARVAGADLVSTLHAAARPAIVIKNLDAPTSRWGASARLRDAATLTRRCGFVLLSLYPEWQSSLGQYLPAGHDITVLPLPGGLAQLRDTVERVGRRTAHRWTAS